MKPIIRWVGGKSKLLPEILNNMPEENFSRYLEPFLGGAAVLFKLKHNEAIVNDLNKELINLYEITRDEPDKLMEIMKSHENNHSKSYFYKIRSLDRTENFKKLSPVFRASRFVYLNKAGYNGMYRVNSKGQMNVPFNKDKYVNLYDKNNIRSVSNYFKKFKVKFESRDFYSFLKENVRKGDFIYIDPPYDPINKTSSFTSYQKNGFNEEDQLRLRDICLYIDKVGAKFLLSNSNTKFINEIYNHDSFIIKKVYATRRINSDPLGRGKIKEVLVRNYKIKGD